MSILHFTQKDNYFLQPIWTIHTCTSTYRSYKVCHWSISPKAYTDIELHEQWYTLVILLFGLRMNGNILAQKNNVLFAERQQFFVGTIVRCGLKECRSSYHFGSFFHLDLGYWLITAKPGAKHLCSITLDWAEGVVGNYFKMIAYHGQAK